MTNFNSSNSPTCRAFGWLYDNHPRTAISNLNLLVEPVCDAPKKSPGSGRSHGYWKDLLNILALETIGELRGGDLSYLNHPRTQRTSPNRRRSKVGKPESGADANARAKEAAAKECKKKNEQFHDHLLTRLKEPQFRALFIAVARLFANQLLKDVKVLDGLYSAENRIALLKTLSLAGKWAPTPGGSHDRVTNIATAICELIYASGSFTYPSILKTSISDEERARVLLSFYQRWILTELRRALSCPEPLMSANRWTEIKYNFIPSICMKNNQEHFLKHDPDGFEKYLTAVESGEKTISGATLLPHELLAQVLELDDSSTGKTKSVAIRDLKKKIASSKICVVEAQWKTLISNLREAGSIKNSIAVCDVSGSMGSIYGKYNNRYVAPILPAVSLSLVLASLAKPPFNGGFITFSANPKYKRLDPNEPLTEQVAKVVGSDWGMNTNFSSVFLHLLLPLAIKNKIKQADMIKRLFVFSDMQFDEAIANGTRNQKFGGGWATNYDVIETEYKKAGYEVPQIVYWDLAAAPVKEVEDSRKKGVAMMNGFSPAMLKVFMGEEEEEEVSTDWGKVEEDGCYGG